MQSLMIFSLAVLSAATPEGIVLIEAESFDVQDGYTGWVVDQQFMDQMGSAYLLAHGLGVPVEDVSKTVTIPKTGPWRVWVRTRDWTAPWKAPEPPGRFQLLVNGAPLDTVFGTEGEDWHWQDGGLAMLVAGDITLTLRDLTGFNGRCDAILLSSDVNFVPPDGGAALAAFRREALGLPDVPPDAGHFDFVVVGGGMGGTCAAISAARMGLNTALIQDRPVLGGNNSSEVRVHLNGKINLPPYPALGNLVKELDPGKQGNAKPPENYDDPKKLSLAESQPSLTLFTNMRAYAIEMDGNRIAAVIARNIRTSEERRFTAPLFADCTGDGTVGFLAGADYRMGREGQDETGESLAPETGDKMTLGSSVQWYSVETEEASVFPECPWALEFNEENCQKVTQGEWDWEVGMFNCQIEEFEYIRDHALRAIFGNWAFLKNHHQEREQYAKRKLDWVAYIAGKRESRRLLGDVILQQQDIESKKEFPDACVTTTWSIDLHYPEPRNAAQFPGQEFRAICEQREIEPYSIPYRCLYSRNIDNLMMAGRNISVTHVALGTVRVMRTGGMMGEVIGLAASLCKQHDTSPRGVYEQHLDELKNLMQTGVPPLSRGSCPSRADSNDETLTVYWKDHELMRYRHGGVPFKPYVDRFVTPAGINILRDAPHDHLHHHALMYAISADGINFWEETPKAGKIVPAVSNYKYTLGESRASQSWIGPVWRLAWQSPEGDAVLLEDRCVLASLDETSPATMLRWQSEFRPAPGKDNVTLSGSHYFGLGMRFLVSMDKDGAFMMPDGGKPQGEVVRGDEQLTSGHWCAYTAEADGKPVTVAMFDHPGNVRPVLWFTMQTPFAYLSATLNLWKEPLELAAEDTLVLRYGAALWDGRIEASQIEAVYQRWLAAENEALRRFSDPESDFSQDIARHK